MDISTIQEDLDAIKAEYDAKVEQIREVGLVKLFGSFFESNPDIKAVSFVGYIPGFNDGDPCVFGLGEINFAKEEADLDEETPEYSADDEEFEGWFTTPSETKWVKNPSFKDRSYQERKANPNPRLDNYYLKDSNGKIVTTPNPMYREDLTEISNFIANNEDLMNKLFGDNFKVVITPKEIRVEEYDCGY